MKAEVSVIDVKNVGECGKSLGESVINGVKQGMWG